MPERIIIIGTDAPALNGVLDYMQTRSDDCPVEAVVLCPEESPLPGLSCPTMERFMGRGLDFSEEFRAIGIDPENRHVLVRNVVSGAESGMAYDRLILAAGASPVDLEIPGEHFHTIPRIGTDQDARRLKSMDGRTVVVGSGHNLLLAVSTLLRHENETIDVIPVPNPAGFRPLSDSLKSMVFHHLREQGVTIHEGHVLQELASEGKNIRVVTDKTVITAGRVVNATPSHPVTAVIREAGFEMDAIGGIVVNDRLETSFPNVFACGSCAAFKGAACKKAIPGAAIRMTENRQASTLSAVLDGRDSRFAAPICAYSVDMNGLTVAGAGLTVEAGRQCGFTPMSAMAVQFDRAHFMPDAKLMTLELVFDAPTRRVIGIQGLGGSGDVLCGRVSAVAAILSRKPLIEDVANLEVAYAPPFASAMDVLNTVANVADNMLAGINRTMDAEAFKRAWSERENNKDFFLDCRELGNAQPFLERHPLHWNHIPQGQIARRLSEIPEDKRIVLVCNTGTRAYEAQVSLRGAGFKDVINVEGGMAALRQSGAKL